MSSRSQVYCLSIGYYNKVLAIRIVLMSATVQDNRLRAFAGFFKGYMGIMPLVTAAVAPLLTIMKAVPVFESQKSTLATYSGLLGFLLVAWVFYARRAFAVA